jgi:hypothetical protein
MFYVDVDAGAAARSWNGSLVTKNVWKTQLCKTKAQSQTLGSIINKANMRSSRFQLTPDSMIKFRTTLCKMLQTRFRNSMHNLETREQHRKRAPTLLRQWVHALLQSLRFLRQVLASDFLGWLLEKMSGNIDEETPKHWIGKLDLQLHDSRGKSPILLTQSITFSLKRGDLGF